MTNGTRAPIETRTAAITLESGIVRVRLFPKLKQTLGDAKANFFSALSLRPGVRTALLIDIRESEMLDAKVRNFYANQPLDGEVSAVGVLTSASGFGLMIGNIYLHLSRHSVPTQLFSNEEDALRWLAGASSRKLRIQP